MKWTCSRAVALTLMLGACASARPQEQPRPVETVDAGALQPSAAGSFPASPLVPVGISKMRQYLGAACDPTRSVASEGAALIVRDPEVLARFPLERALQQIIATAESSSSPTELLQRLFDTQNASTKAVFADNPHCDSLAKDGLALENPVDCPRAEGELARSAGLLVAGHPDSFAPVAIINRFDLIPDTRDSCGEYRILYAKQSGRTNPDARMFLMLEGALDNPSRDLADCRPVAELWASLPSAASPGIVADRLEQFFFEGSDKLKPVVHAQHYGLRPASSCDYAGNCGQIRIGQGMQSPWQFRQFRLRTKVLREQRGPDLFFVPTPDTSSPRPELFDTQGSDSQGEWFRSEFVSSHVVTLSEPEITRLRLLSLAEHEAVESALDGPAQSNYARMADRPGWPVLEQQIAKRLETPDVTKHTSMCPPDDPLTPRAMLRRATAVTCAGCHAPDQLLAPDRALGCGQTQPKSLGKVHIDEQGTLSEALTNVYLPYRASVLSTYLQACDHDAIERNLQPVPARIIVECFAAGTAITMADGSEKPIERVLAGEAVLAFDEASRTLVQAQVARSVVRPNADRLVVINDLLTATANHPFYTTYGLKRADELQLGDTVFEASASHATHDRQLSIAPTTVERLALREGSVPTYNLEVSTHHNYFAAGLLVHDRP